MATFIAGAYTWTLGGNALGVVEDACQMEVTPVVDPIVGDDLGATIQDGVYRGGNCYISMVLQQYDAAGGRAAFWPYADTFGKVGTVGALLSSFAAALVGTKVAGPNASPSNITATYAVLAPGHPISMLFGSRHRNIPVRFLLLPFVYNSVTYFWRDAS